MRPPRERLNSREGLLDQLGYLLIELEAIEPILAGISPGVLTVSLPETGSVLDVLTEFSYLDESVHLPAVRGEEVGEEVLEAEPVQPDVEFAEAVAQVRSTRTKLIEAFRELAGSEWDREVVIGEARLSVQDLALAIVRRDAGVLRELSENLRHGSLFGEG